MSSRKIQNTAEQGGSCLHSQQSGKPRPEGCWEFETSLGYIVSFKVSVGYSMRCCFRPKNKQTNKRQQAKLKTTRRNYKLREDPEMKEKGLDKGVF